MRMTRIYIAIDSRSPRITKKNYGYVLECEVSGEARTREGFGTVTGTYHQATLTALIKALERFTQKCELHIHTEDMFVLNMMLKNLDAWEANGFTTSKGSPVANREEWMEVEPVEGAPDSAGAGKAPIHGMATGGNTEMEGAGKCLISLGNSTPTRKSMN